MPDEDTSGHSTRLDKLENRVEALRLDHQTHKTLVGIAGGLALTIIGGAAWLGMTTVTLNSRMNQMEGRAAAQQLDQRAADNQLRETHDAVVRMEAQVSSMNEHLQNLDVRLQHSSSPREALPR